MSETPKKSGAKWARIGAAKVQEAVLEAATHAKISEGEAPVKFDIEQAFQLYATFCGDVERTAHALNVSPVDVLRTADEERWSERLKSILELKKSARPGDIERGINRALNFVQAHKMRLFVERLLKKFSTLTDEELENFCFSVTTDEDGNVNRKLVTRPFADLATAMEKCQALTYQALNDTATERVKRDEHQDHGSAGSLHAALAEAMSKVRGSQTPRAALFEAQLQQAQDIVDNPK
jgi:hypothetical protein